MKKNVSAGLILGLLLVGTVGVAGATPIMWSDNGHQYDVIYRQGTTWANARAGALSLGSGWDLATITSLEEQLFVADILSSPPVAPSPFAEFYIGGRYVGNGVYAKENWTWVTGEAFSFSYWGGIEPNNTTITGTTEPFIALDSRYRTPDWGWNNYLGDGPAFVKGYVVENHIAAVPEPSTLLLLGGGLLGLVGLGRRRRA